MIGFKIEKSKCEKFVRIWVNGAWLMMTMGEWSKAISSPGSFRVVEAA